MWYVAQVRTTSQMCGRRYRDGDLSPVEEQLRRNGFDFYMPVEKRLDRMRSMTNVHMERRVPVIPGYVFVQNVYNFKRLEKDTPGVIGVVRFEGRPYPMPDSDIGLLQRLEAECEAAFQRDCARRAFAASKLTRNKAKRLLPRGSHVAITAGHLSGREGYVSGFDRDGKVKLMISMLNSLSVSVDVQDVQMVAA